jgi:predicted dehydrogenase
LSKLGWGVIGAGGIADRRTIPEGIIPAANAQLVGVVSSTPERSAAIATKYGVRTYANIAELLADPKIGAVYIATPNHQHHDQCLAAAAAGKHVLCEKPLALTSAEAEAMAAACRKAAVLLGAGFMMRFNPYHQRIREMIANGELGTIVFCRAQLTCWYPPMDNAWRQDSSQGGGGAIMDLAVHCLDLLEMLLGPIGEVSGYVEQRVHDYRADDTNALLLKFQCGAFGVVDCAFNIPDEASENVLEVQGTLGCVKARMTVGQGPGGIVQVCTLQNMGSYEAAQTRNGATYQPLELEPANTYRSQIEAFSRSVLEGANFPAGAEAGVRSMKLVEAIRRAASSKTVQAV